MCAHVECAFAHLSSSDVVVQQVSLMKLARTLDGKTRETVLRHLQAAPLRWDVLWKESLPLTFVMSDAKRTVFDTAEAWFQATAKTTCEGRSDMTVGNCAAPKRGQFHTDEEFERAQEMRKDNQRRYLREYMRTKEMNARARERYAEQKTTEDGRKKLKAKAEQDEVNKRLRKERAERQGLVTCCVGPHVAPDSHFYFCPVDDLGVQDYRGPLGRSVRRGVCKEHFVKTLARGRRHNAKESRKEYNKKKEMEERVKAVRRKWKLENRERYNAAVNKHRMDHPDLREKRRLACAEYQSVPENAFRLRVIQTKHSAKERGLSYELTNAKEDELFSLDARCYHCDNGPVGVRPLGPDRLDHTVRAYTDEGTVACCKPCNFARGTMPLEDFRTACRNIVLFQHLGIKATQRISYMFGNTVKTRGVKYHMLKYRALKKGLVVGITRADHKRLQATECYLCGIEATDSVKNGVDRRDNKVGYTVANSFPCCTCCNLMKRTTPFDVFVETCVRIYKKAAAC